MSFKDVLVPTDFGSGSHVALSQALDNLEPEGGRVVVLHVLDQRLIDPIQTLFSEHEKEELTDRLRHQANEQYAQLMAKIDTGKAECELLLVEGVPFMKIVQFAHDLDVDVIVMLVRRGSAYVEQMLFGSTAERVLRLAPCPVLIVPETVNEAKAKL